MGGRESVVDEPDEPLVAAEWAADGPTRSLHADTALRASVVTTHGLPSQLVRLEADGALVGGGGDLEGGLCDLGDGVAWVGRDEQPRHLVPDALDALEDGLDAPSAEPCPLLATDVVDAPEEERDEVVRGLHVGDHVAGEDDDDTLAGDRDRDRMTDGTLVGGNHTATLDGGSGESRGGVRGEVDLADGGDVIMKPNRPSTTVGAHRGRAGTLHTVLTVPDVRLPNDAGHVRGDRDLSGHGGLCGRVSGCGHL